MPDPALADHLRRLVRGWQQRATTTNPGGEAPGISWRRWPTRVSSTRTYPAHSSLTTSRPMRWTTLTGSSIPGPSATRHRSRRPTDAVGDLSGVAATSQMVHVTMPSDEVVSRGCLSPLPGVPVTCRRR
jgi:hypothetical protein